MVTGANGFVGRHLLHELNLRGHRIIAVGHGGQLNPELQSLVESYHECDLSSADQVSKLPLQNLNAVINLAGLANVGASFADAEKYKSLNVAMLTVLGQRLVDIKSTARVVAISTGAAYRSDQSMPLTEDSATIDQSGSPYAFSKLMMEQAASNLRQKGLNVVVARPFNHAGPGQAPGFLIPDLYAKIMAAKQTGTIKVGNLATKRDYTDVRDVARAYADIAAAETLDHTVYNICSGQSHDGQEILEIFLNKLNLADKIRTEADAKLIRPNDPPNLYGSHDRLTEETGWEPTIPLDKTIEDFIFSQ